MILNVQNGDFLQLICIYQVTYLYKDYVTKPEPKLDKLIIFKT